MRLTIAEDLMLQANITALWLIEWSYCRSKFFIVGRGIFDLNYGYSCWQHTAVFWLTESGCPVAGWKHAPQVQSWWIQQTDKTDTQTDRQTDRQTHRQTDRQRLTGIYAAKECSNQVQSRWIQQTDKTDTQTDRQTDTQTDRQTDRHTDSETDRQTDRQRLTGIYTAIECSNQVQSRWIQQSDVVTGIESRSVT